MVGAACPRGSVCVRTQTRALLRADGFSLRGRRVHLCGGVMPLFRLFSGRSSKQSKGAGSGCTSTIHDPAFAVSATVGHVSLSPEAYRKKRLDPFNYRYESGPQGEEVGACWFVFDVNAFSSSRAPDPTPTTI